MYYFLLGISNASICIWFFLSCTKIQMSLQFKSMWMNEPSFFFLFDADSSKINWLDLGNFISFPFQHSSLSLSGSLFSSPFCFYFSPVIIFVFHLFSYFSFTYFLPFYFLFSLIFFLFSFSDLTFFLFHSSFSFCSLCRVFPSLSYVFNRNRFFL